MITPEQIALYWGQAYRPEIRKKADTIAAAVQIHSRKLTPTAILEAFRPNETDDHRKYRKAVWKPITYGWFNKVMQQFAKIRRAEDWRIEWPAQVANNPLQEYAQGKFAEYDTVENWFFNYHIRNVLDDPNGVLVVLPRNIEDILMRRTPLNPGEAFQPTVFYFPSSVIAEYTENLLVINALEQEVDSLGRPLANVQRQVQYLFDQDQVVKLVKTGNNERPTYSRYDYTHRLGFTAFLNGGLIVDDQQKERRKLYDSFIAPALPFWEAAISGESDHQVNMALHLHPDRWEFASSVCTHKINGRQCQEGTILLRGLRGDEPTQCPKCLGGGKIATKTPFGVTRIQREAAGFGKAGEVGPIPPGGYFERPVETIKITKELADAKIYDGLDALGLGMLGTVPLNISGKAKEMDYQEVDTFVAAFAAHIVDNIFVNVFYYFSVWLMPALPEDTRKKFQPTVNKPRKFDLVTTEIWMARLDAYKKNGSATAQAQAEIKLAERQYGADSTAFYHVRDSVLLDPLFGLSPEQKDTTALGGGCSREAYVVSTQIGYFITRAVVETKSKFFDLDFVDKAQLLLKYAQETLAPAGALSGALGGAQDPANPQLDGAADPTAALRGSVGGSAIIRQLRTDVIKGLSSRAAALAQIQIQLGYTAEQAEQMLGETPLNLKDEVKAGEIAATAT